MYSLPHCCDKGGKGFDKTDIFQHVTHGEDENDKADKRNKTNMPKPISNQINLT